MENEIKRCFLNNVLQRFDKKDKGTTGTEDFTDCFHKQWGKFASFMWKTVLADSHSRRWKCYAHHWDGQKSTNTSDTQPPRTHSEPFLSFHQYTDERLPESSLDTKTLPASHRNISVFFQRTLHYAVFWFLQCDSVDRNIQEFLVKPQKFNLTRRDNFSISFSCSVSRSW